MVRDTLVEKGLPANRIRVISRGPTAGFESVESRRVEVRVDDGRQGARRR
jgi:outer membrane protein OmpA-like peptidoglycan-associated protein